MRPLKLGLALSLLAAGTSIQAATFEFDSFTVEWDTVLTAGTQFRIESQNPRIAHGVDGSGGELDDLVTIIDNAFVINGNDGNNNFDKGSMTSLRFGVLTEADINFGDYGLFVRGRLWQDRRYGMTTDADDTLSWGENNANPFHNPNNKYNTAFGEFNPGAEAYNKSGAEILDFFVYGSLMFGERDVNFKLGRQVISWGEALLSGGGMATSINHLDAHVRSTPGVEIKELFQPSGALSISTSLTDTIGLEMYYQYEWNPYILDPSSSFMSEFDPFGDGGSNFLFISGQEQQILGRRLNANDGLDPYDPNSGYNHELDQLLRFMPLPYQPVDFDLDGNFAAHEYIGCAPDDDNTSRCRVLTQEHYKTITPKNTGQYGIAMNFFMEDGAEIGVYYVNYHEKIPNFDLPIDAIDGFAPIIEVLLYAADPSNPVDFEGVQSISGDLSDKQLVALLTFMDAVPETDGSVANVANEVLNDPDVLAAFIGDDARFIDFVNNINDTKIARAVLDAVGYTGANTFLKPYKYGAESTVRSINYRVEYLESTHIIAATYSTVIGDANVAAEITYRPNAPLMRGDVPRTIDRRQLVQLHINSLMVLPPTMFWDFSSLVVEGIFWHVPNGEEFDVNDIGNKRRLAVQNSPQGVGFSAFWNWDHQSIIDGWDLTIPWYLNWGIDGAMLTSGYRDGQVTFATGAVLKNTDGLEVGVSVMTNFGDTDDIFQMALQDRDNASLFIKYAF